MNICCLRRNFRYITLYFISWKTLIFLGFLALSLQTVNIGLSWWIQVGNSKKTEIKDGFPVHSSESTLTISEVLGHISQASVLDSSGEFKFVVDVTELSTKRPYQYYAKEDGFGGSEVQNEKNAVTLTSQCSLSHLHLVPELAERWEGPLSIAVFLLTEEIEVGVHMILLLHKCFKCIRSRVVFSIVYPLIPPSVPLTVTVKDVPCHLVISSLSRHNRSNYEFKAIPYPNNLLRNVAHKAVKSNYMMVLDIDMLPSKQLHSRFINYVTDAKKSLQISSEEEKTVWVVPSYEIKENSQIPEDKNDLLQLRKSGLARPFYQELCWKCQKYTEYDSWEKHISSDSKNLSSILPLYEVLWKDPWEPFYISKSSVPSYDERFRQYGFNRISQVCELHVAGYRFLVLDSAFVVHRGFKKLGQFHKRKEEEMEKNRLIFREFKANLKEKYSESSRRCY